jgi:putative tricarboxylic transport membrane protein
MHAVLRDRVTGFVLLAFSVLWCLVVWQTIPEGTPGTVGPRAFPLGLGLALALLACFLVARSLKDISNADDDGESGTTTDSNHGLYLRMVASVFVFIVVYGFLMEKIGFVVSTLVVVPALMVFVLRIRSFKSIAAMTIGLAFGCWLVFGKLLGAYMPPGTWLSLF